LKAAKILPWTALERTRSVDDVHAHREAVDLHGQGDRFTRLLYE